MSSLQDLKKKLSGKLSMTQREQMQAREQRAATRVLPPDLSGQIFELARTEAATTRAAIDAIDVELARIEPLIQAARAEIAAKYALILAPARVTGDILGDYDVEDPQPIPRVAVNTPEAIKLRNERVIPLENWRERLTLQRHSLQKELADLRRTALLAGSGDPALLGYLSDRMRAQMVLWRIPVKLPEKQKPILSDAMGYELPSSTIGVDGRVDINLSGRADDTMISVHAE